MEKSAKEARRKEPGDDQFAVFSYQKSQSMKLILVSARNEKETTRRKMISYFSSS